MNLFWCLLFAAVAWGQSTQPDGAGVRGGTFPKTWVTGGPDCANVPAWQVHAYNENFYILRESGCTDYEKPVLYLLFGEDRALLEDTGSGENDSARVVSGIIAEWCHRNGRGALPLVVTHSHSHGDHVAGDAQFKMLPNTAMVPLTIAGTSEAFHIAQWPESTGSIDLGGRILDVIAIPGHDALSMAFYDRQTGILLSGDSLYPGRLYVRDFPEFARSTQRLVDFTRGKIVAHVLGTHIEEMEQPYRDYPVGTRYQPQEHELALARGSLLELNEAVGAMKSKPSRLALRDLTIWPKTNP